jgi:hypothetical protein
MLQQTNTNLDWLRADLGGQLTQSREKLCFVIEQRDQLCTDGDAVRAQITQLQSDLASTMVSELLYNEGERLSFLGSSFTVM